MKDKRQRIAVAWPYAAVYADPVFAASLLQAAANSVNMPCYGPNPMMGQMPLVMPSQIPSAIPNHYTYSVLPYQFARRNATCIPPSTHSLAMSTPSTGTILTKEELGSGHTNPFFSNYLQSPVSPLSPLSLSPGSESEKVSINF